MYANRYIRTCINYFRNNWVFNRIDLILKSLLIKWLWTKHHCTINVIKNQWQWSEIYEAVITVILNSREIYLKNFEISMEWYNVRKKISQKLFLFFFVDRTKVLNSVNSTKSILKSTIMFKNNIFINIQNWLLIKKRLWVMRLKFVVFTRNYVN